LIRPFTAAYYSAKNRKQISALAVSDLDTAEHLWGGMDNSKAFRNVLLGSPERRGEIWQAWISAGEMELSDDSCFYVLRQKCEIDGKHLVRWGLYCELDLNEKQLLIHEDVLPEAVERARQATEACEADMAPIFVGYDESLAREMRMWLESAVQGQEPLLVFQESAQTMHEVWPLPAGVPAEHLLNLMKDAPLFLLDGHHRLAAARANHRLGMGDGKILACLCSMAPVDTLILPIHRAVHLERWMLQATLLGDLAKAGCKVTEEPGLKVSEMHAFMEKRSQRPAPYCLLLHSHSDKPYLVELPVVASLPEQLASLPVACLDSGILPQFPAVCLPVPSLETALEQLALEQAQAAFFLPPVQPAQVRAIALSHLKMPRKSTRFVPKPALGLLCRPWSSSG
jgi:hypothetical protein